ncbi:cupin domain-containing protein [Caldinitratiruptor microaerophilus]|uniref:Cupin n=1 Tax=Caldinitratiruptor microaerophilus TaxID=671077 RepID=A0AA35CIQ6_9FIRM|nr:cupin domain-containing protein [Caldinitratiruptor microaerophilus]BDG59199.1 cupin [Caldinitratiruptor microaerophilus]
MGGNIDWSAQAAREPYPGVVARRWDGANMTVVRYEFAPGAVFPDHHHPEEQLAIVLQGTIEFHVGARTILLGRGDEAFVPGGVPHSARAGPTGAVMLNIVAPRRGGESFPYAGT